MTLTPIHRLSGRLAASLLAAAALAACAQMPADGGGPQSATPLDTWSSRVQIDRQPDEIRLATHASGLSEAQAAALAGLFGRWAAAEVDEIVIQSPYGSADPAGAYRVGEGARQFLIAQGAPAGRVRLVGYDPEGAPDAPVIVGFEVASATPPRCGLEWENLSGSQANQPHANFGCAVSANLAAQVANPADLLGPRTMSPASAQRRDTVMGKYRAGEATSAAAEPNGAGNISTAVN